MPIVQQGSINTTAQIVPDLWVQIIPPQNLIINGVPTNRLGAVGTASWGPVNQSVIVGSASDYARNFGSVMNRKFDLGTGVAIAIQQGASDFRCVRVSDGTDVAAAVEIDTNCLLLTAIYTGTLGNTIIATIGAGAKAASFRLTIAAPGLQTEIFDNLTGSGNALWVAMANAVNLGNGALRGPSQLVRGLAGAGVVVPSTTPASFTLGTTTPGTDGVATITTATLIGNDNTTLRTGMYALRSQGCGVVMLADADDPTHWTDQCGFALGESCYVIGVVAAGTPIQNGTTGAVDLKTTAGIDCYGFKLMHGDWIYWNDQSNGVTRLVSPQGFVAGRLANLSPEQSSLNKPLYGVVGSQRSGLPGASTFQTYSTAELSALIQNGIDVIANPVPGGSYWGVRAGHNTSSNQAVHGDNYTRMTNFIATSLNVGMGIYVGRLVNPTLFKQVKSTLMSFLQNMLQQGILGLTSDGKLPMSVVCDFSNNPDSRTGLGYVQADVQVKYQPINEFFFVNLEGGQTVTVTRQTLPGGQV